jgi:hypothetical protein
MKSLPERGRSCPSNGAFSQPGGLRALRQE